MEAIAEKLEQLEKKVKELLNELKGIRSEKEDLAARLSDKERELANLRVDLSQWETKKSEAAERLEYVRRLEAERDEIRTKVGEMLAELEKIKEAE